MIFDAFIIRDSALPSSVSKKYSCSSNAIFVFADEPIKERDINLTDGRLAVKGETFSYSFMADISRDNTPVADLYIHKVNRSAWEAQVKAYKSLYRSNIDKAAILNECSDLPFLDNASAIDFFIDEVTFSKNGGIAPIGLCLLDLSANDMYSHLCARRKMTLQR